MNTKILFILFSISVCLIFFIVGIVVGYKIGETPAFNINPANIHRICTQLLFGKTPGKITQVQGVIKSLEANKLKMQVNKGFPYSVNVLLPDTITVSFSPDVEVVKRYLMTEEEYNKAKEEYNQLSEEEKKQTSPPSPFYERKTTLNELKVGEEIIIESSEDLLGKSEVKASKIVILAF